MTDCVPKVRLKTAVRGQVSLRRVGGISVEGEAGPLSALQVRSCDGVRGQKGTGAPQWPEGPSGKWSGVLPGRVWS